MNETKTYTRTDCLGETLHWSYAVARNYARSYGHTDYILVDVVENGMAKVGIVVKDAA